MGGGTNKVQVYEKPGLIPESQFLCGRDMKEVEKKMNNQLT